MVQVGIIKEDQTEETIKEDAQEELKRPSEQAARADEQKKREVPLEKMTKAGLLEEIGEVQKSAKKNFDLYVRAQAEMDNMKKRFQREKLELSKFSNESLIKQLLPVIDNLEKAISHSEDENSLDVLREGIKLTLKGLVDSLKKAGLEEVKAVGRTFDPHFHEAVSGREDKNVEDGTVLEELQRGYILNERLIRPAMVIVSKNRTCN